MRSSSTAPKVTFINTVVGGKMMHRDDNEAATLCKHVFIAGWCEQSNAIIVDRLPFLGFVFFALFLFATLIYLRHYDRMLITNDYDTSIQVGKTKHSKCKRKGSVRDRKHTSPVRSSVTANSIVDASTEEDKTCIVCMDAPIDAAVLHSGSVHVCCCMDCAQTIYKSYGECPMCRVPIESVLRVFHS